MSTNVSSSKKNGSKKDGKSHPSPSLVTKAGRRSNPTPPTKATPVRAEGIRLASPIKDEVKAEAVEKQISLSGISFIERACPITASLMREAAIAKIKQLADAREVHLDAMSVLKEQGALLSRNIKVIENDLAIMAESFIKHVTETERLIAKFDPAMVSIADAELIELATKCVKRAEEMWNEIDAMQARKDANGVVFRAHVNALNHIDDEIAEWKAIF